MHYATAYKSYFLPHPSELNHGLDRRAANALLELPQQASVLPAGSIVSALLIADLAAMPVLQHVPSGDSTV